MSTQKWPLQIVVGAKDAASATLRRINSTLSGVGSTWAKFNGVMRMSGISRALGRVRDFTLGLGRSFIDAGRKAALFGSIAGAALGAVIAKVTGAGDKTIKFARDVLGVSVERFQEWRFAAERAGVATEQFESNLQRLSGRIGRARTGDMKASEPFRVLGIALNDASGQARGLEDLLPEIADGLAAIDVGDKRNAFAQAFFGDEGIAINRLFAGGAKGLDDMAAEARRLGAVVSEDKLQGFERFQDTLTNLKSQVGGVAATLTDALLPAIERVAGGFSAWLVDNQARVELWANWIGEKLPRALGAFWDEAKAFWAWLEPKMRWIDETILGGRWTDFFRALGVLDNENTDAKARKSQERSGAAAERRSQAAGAAVLDVGPQAAVPAAQVTGGLMVSFANMPRGARVTRDDEARRWTSLDVGYAMPDLGGAFR